MFQCFRNEVTLLYAKSSRLLRTCSQWTIGIRVTLFKRYCTSLYFPFCGVIITSQHLFKFMSHSTMSFQEDLLFQSGICVIAIR